MKILITTENNSPTANYFIRQGYARAFQACGHDVQLFGLGSKPIFDIFDEFEPDLFMTQTYNVNKAMALCIEERPAMKVIMKGSDFGIAQKYIDLKEYPILVASDKEIHTITELFNNTGKPDFVHGHYHPNRIDSTHGLWELTGTKVIGLMSAADIFSFTNGQKRDAFASDITFVGGYWGYKAKTLDKYILPLCNPDKKYKVKIFGNQSWGVPQFCGFLDEQFVKDALSSAVICPSVSEPHSQMFGVDIIERPWKILSNKCFCISDYVESMAKDVFTNNEIVFAKSPEEFEEKIQYYLKNPDERLPFIQRGYETVLSFHTYFNRIATIFDNLNLPWEADHVEQTFKDIRKSSL